MAYPEDNAIGLPGQIITTANTTMSTSLQSDTTDKLIEQVAELEALVKYACTVSPEFKRIVAGFKAKKRIG